MNKAVSRLFFLNYLLLLVIFISFAVFIHAPNAAAIVFAVAVSLSYALAVLLPAAAVVGGVQVLAMCFKGADRPWLRRSVYTLAVVCLSFTVAVLLVDRVIFKMYGFHFNGFVWNLLTTPGGIESMGFDRAAVWSAAAMALGLLAGQALLLWACIAWSRSKPGRTGKLLHIAHKSMPFIAGIMFIVQALIYGCSHFYARGDILTASNAFPFFQPITFASQLEAFGLEPVRQRILSARQGGDGALRYPHHPLVLPEKSPRYNIVWLVAESLRADMLNPEVMPQTWAFAQQAQHFTHHYSGGNGTRHALFSMFYGLYGNYWFKMLNERRSPVLMDLLQQNDYQIELFTSAKFSYPEFDKTIFAGIDKTHLHADGEGPGWQRDRTNVSSLLQFLTDRDPQRPFMTFMFFESPHARYYFPPECAIRKPYLDDFNYATVNLEKDMPLIFNRYVNSCYHLDTQYGRVIDYLKANGLLDSTIVILTGDHGEEFMEHGRWGHNSTFTEQQIRSPLVMWIPGMPARTHPQVTSHLDIPATVLTTLGVTNPPDDYTLGVNLLSGQGDPYVILSDWSDLVYCDSDCKIVLPLKATGGMGQIVTTADDQGVPDASAVYAAKTPRLVEVLKKAGAFIKKR